MGYYIILSFLDYLYLWVVINHPEAKINFYFFTPPDNLKHLKCNGDFPPLVFNLFMHCLNFI